MNNRFVSLLACLLVTSCSVDRNTSRTLIYHGAPHLCFELISNIPDLRDHYSLKNNDTELYADIGVYPKIRYDMDRTLFPSAGDGIDYWPGQWVFDYERQYPGISVKLTKNVEELLVSINGASNWNQNKKDSVGWMMKTIYPGSTVSVVYVQQ